MSNWVQRARKGETGTAEEGVPAVNVPATPEWAERLSQRLEALNRLIQPIFKDESFSDN